MEGMNHHYEGSECGRYIYGIITEEKTGEVIDRYVSEDLMETMYGGA
jgi:hypothetical protein